MEATPGRVTAIVAAYNEAERISQVLEVLCSYPGFAEVIVVDDGSTDGTGAVVGRYPVTYIRVDPNQGKGHAMDVGVVHASTDVVFFADADIEGLTHDMIEATVAPVLEDVCEMFILMRNRRIYFLKKLMAFIPLLGGERALARRLWEELPERYKAGFRIETALNFYAIHWGRGLRYRVFPGISQTVKEAKFGFWEGFRRRMRMFGEVVAAAWDLQWNDLPPTARALRAGLGMAALSAAGMLLAVLVIAAGVTGPSMFVSALFSEELREDPGAPVARFLLRWATGLSSGAVVTVGGVLLAMNAAFFLRTIARLLTFGRIRLPG